jgi:toxin CptA
LDAALWLAHALAAFAVSWTPFWPAAKLALCLPIAWSLWRQLHRTLPAEIVLKADGKLLWVDQDGRSREGAVAADTAVFPWLVILRLKIDGQSRALGLPLDALCADGHRRLRLWLRWLAVSDRA